MQNNLTTNSCSTIPLNGSDKRKGKHPATIKKYQGVLRFVNFVIIIANIIIR